MDSVTSIFQERSSEPTFSGFRYLTVLQRDPVDGEELKSLWEKVKTQEYAFDDFGRNRVDWFLCQLADENSEFLKIGDHGLFMINHPIEKGTADLHFVVWDNYSLYRERQVIKELFDWLFYEKKVHRIQGMVPNYNQLAQRFCMACGLRYEGEMQEAVLWKSKYWSVKMFALLEQQYRVRRERMLTQ